jgi:hypothetical protein
VPAGSGSQSEVKASVAGARRRPAAAGMRGGRIELGLESR